MVTSDPASQHRARHGPAPTRGHPRPYPACHGRARPHPVLPWPRHTQPRSAMAMPRKCSCFFFLVFVRKNVVYLSYESLKIFYIAYESKGTRGHSNQNLELRCKPSTFSQIHIRRPHPPWSYSRWSWCSKFMFSHLELS